MKPVASGSCLFLRVRGVNLCGGSYKWRFSLLGRCGGADTVSRSRGMLARRHGAEGTAGGEAPMAIGQTQAEPRTQCFNLMNSLLER